MNVQIPERLPLVDLPPAGLGTAWVESLESYVARLAVIHRVSPAAIITLGLRGTGRAVERHPDHPGQVRLDLAARLAALTGRTEVAGLGLGRFTEVLSQSHTLRSWHSWCPECLAAMGTPYLPLVWSTMGYLHCSVHDRPMVEACDCGERFPVGRGLSGAFRCPRCRMALVDSRPEPPRKATPFDVAISRALEVFCRDLAVLPLGPFEPPDYARAIRVAAQRQQQSTTQLCQGIGLRAPDLIHGYLKPRRSRMLKRAQGEATARARSVPPVMKRPPLNLGAIARLCALAGIPIAGLFEDSLWVADEAAPQFRTDGLHLVHSCARKDYSHYRTMVLRWLEEGQPWGINEMARRLDTHYGVLKFILGADLARRVVENGQAARLTEISRRLGLQRQA